MSLAFDIVVGRAKICTRDGESSAGKVGRVRAILLDDTSAFKY